MIRFNGGKSRVLVKRLAIQRLEVIDREQDRVSCENFSKQVEWIHHDTYSVCSPKISIRIERVVGAAF